MLTLFSFAEIGGSKSKTCNFYLIFLNKDISVTKPDIALKFCMMALHIHFEGSVSQIFYLALIFILCDLENNVLKKYKNYPKKQKLRHN